MRPGERLAVVGLPGAGKSTLGRLLAGVDRPGAGTVTVGGVPVADLPPDSLRRHVVLVTQEHHVFAESLRDNLMSPASDETLRAALRTVGATGPPTWSGTRVPSRSTAPRPSSSPWPGWCWPARTR